MGYEAVGAHNCISGTHNGEEIPEIGAAHKPRDVRIACESGKESLGSVYQHAMAREVRPNVRNDTEPALFVNLARDPTGKRRAEDERGICSLLRGKTILRSVLRKTGKDLGGIEKLELDMSFVFAFRRAHALSAECKSKKERESPIDGVPVSKSCLGPAVEAADTLIPADPLSGAQDQRKQVRTGVLVEDIDNISFRQAKHPHKKGGARLRFVESYDLEARVDQWVDLSASRVRNNGNFGLGVRRSKLVEKRGFQQEISVSLQAHYRYAVWHWCT